MVWIVIFSSLFVFACIVGRALGGISAESERRSEEVMADRERQLQDTEWL